MKLEKVFLSRELQSSPQLRIEIGGGSAERVGIYERPMDDRGWIGEIQGLWQLSCQATGVCTSSLSTNAPLNR